MAKDNNLKDLLTDVADAIREKKGTTELINPQDFGEEIRGIESGNVFSETMVDNTGYGIHQQKVVIIADGVTTIMDNAYSRTSITHVYIPDALERINYSAFHTANKLKYISPIPPSLNYIGQQAFAYTILKYLDCRRCVSIPTLGGTAAFSGISIACKIVVPDALYDEWIIATNWATYADRIVKASEFVEPTNE